MSPGRLIETVHWLEGVFDRLSLARSYGGAIAYNFYGPPRLTQDIDVLALVPDLKVPPFLDELTAAGCLHGELEPRPIELGAVLQDFRSKPRLAVFQCKGVRTELFLPWHPFHHRVLERSPEEDLGGRRVRIHSPEDLIVFKKIFDRPKDIQDIKAILLARKGRLNLERLKADAKELLTDGSWNELNALVQESASGSP
jgi:hypothetical protein